MRRHVPRRQHVEDARLLHELFGRAATFKRATDEWQGGPFEDGQAQSGAISGRGAL